MARVKRAAALAAEASIKQRLQKGEAMTRKMAKTRPEKKSMNKPKKRATQEAQSLDTIHGRQAQTIKREESERLMVQEIQSSMTVDQCRNKSREGWPKGRRKRFNVKLFHLKNATPQLWFSDFTKEDVNVTKECSHPTTIVSNAARALKHGFAVLQVIRKFQYSNSFELADSGRLKEQQQVGTISNLYGAIPLEYLVDCTKGVQKLKFTDDMEDSTLVCAARTFRIMEAQLVVGKHEMLQSLWHELPQDLKPEFKKSAPKSFGTEELVVASACYVLEVSPRRSISIRRMTVSAGMDEQEIDEHVHTYWVAQLKQLPAVYTRLYGVLKPGSPIGKSKLAIQIALLQRATMAIQAISVFTEGASIGGTGLSEEALQLRSAKS